MPESKSHVALKQLLVSKLKEWYGASIDEYPSSGHELDVFATTSFGVSIYTEIIWSASKTQFLSDINMLQQSDADVKLVVANPEIITNSELVREFSKVVISQRRQGIAIFGDLLNGQRILEDTHYVEDDLHSLVDQLISKVKKDRPKSETPTLRYLKSTFDSYQRSLKDSSRRFEKVPLNDTHLEGIANDFPVIVTLVVEFRGMAGELNDLVESYVRIAESNIDVLQMPDRHTTLQALFGDEDPDQLAKSRRLKEWARNQAALIDKKREGLLRLAEKISDSLNEAVR